MTDDLKDEQAEQVGEAAVEGEAEPGSEQEAAGQSEEDVLAMAEAAMAEAGLEMGAATEVAEVGIDGGGGQERSGGGEKAAERKKLARILSMEVPVIVKIAERRMQLRNILKWNMGSMIQFEKDAYEHVDLMANNSRIGLGQPIKIGENFGLRITHVGDITDTIKRLGRGGGE